MTVAWRNSKRIASMMIVLLLCSVTALAAIRKGPYLIYEGSSTAMTVLWQTTGPESNDLRWGTDTTCGMGRAMVGVYGSEFQHKYVISGLQPNTKYHYRVDDYGSGSFRTAPEAGATSVKILAYGDTRSTPANQEKVVARMRGRYASDPAFQSIALHSGDWVHNDDENAWAREWFVSGAAYPNIRSFQSEVPVNGVRGNHEGFGTIFSKYYPLPYVSDFYWSFDYGPAHIIVLDQYTSYVESSAQYNWLVNDLRSTTRPWKIIMSHEPGWGAGTHGNNAGIQSIIHPLALQYGVDLLLFGHNHNYARAMVNGIPYITMGGGGAPLSPVNLPAPNIATAVPAFNYCIIDIQADTLTFTAWTNSDSLIDAFTITHRAPETPAGGGPGP